MVSVITLLLLETLLDMNDAMNELTINKLHFMAAAIGSGLIRVELSQHESAQHAAAEQVTQALSDLVNFVENKLAAKGIVVDMTQMEITDDEEK